MKAIILAAGEGKRLGYLTKDRPKCMVNLFGKSLLQRQIEIFHLCDIFDISVVTGYKNEIINLPGITYFKNPKFNTTNMVETLFCARNKLSGSVIISYGDIIYESTILKKLIESIDDITVVVDLYWKKYWKMRFTNILDDAESLVIDEEGFIQDIGRKVTSLDDICGQYIGLMKFQNNGIIDLKKTYDNAKKNSIKLNPLNPNLPFNKSYMTDLLQTMIKSNLKIRAIPVRNGWLELDSIHDYDLYNKMYDDNSLSELIKLET